MLATGCGRLGFANEATPDATTPSDASPAKLACAEPAHVTIGDADALATVATTGGVALFTAASQTIHGWSYGFAPLTATATAKTIATSPTEQFATAASGDRILVAALADDPATKSTLSVLDTALNAVVTNTRTDLATAVAPAPDGWAYATWDPTTAELHGQLLDASLVDVGPRVDLTVLEKPSEPVLIATPTGYALAFVQTKTSPHTAQLALYDGALTKTLEASAACPDDAEHAQVSFAAQSQRYLVTYMDKEPGDAIYAVEYDAQLNVVRAPMRLAQSAYVPKVGTDGTSFYLAWTAEMSDALSGVRIDPAGALATLSYDGGANPAQWTLVTNSDQAVIAWRTDDAAGDVTIAAICN